MQILTSKAGAMSYLLMLVSTGYRHWIRGEMHYSKSARFLAKMSELYPVLATHDQRSWAKKSGRYSCMLVLMPSDKDPTKIMYWLLATPGKTPKGFQDIHAREKMSDALTTPPGWRDQYELSRVEQVGKKATWTWSMRPEYYKRIEASAKETADQGAVALRALFLQLRRMPMFSGIRRQIIELDAFAKVTWAKRRKTAYPNPLKPLDSTVESDDPASFLPIMPKLKVFGDLTLDVLINQMRERELAAAETAKQQALDLLCDDDDLLEGEAS